MRDILARVRNGGDAALRALSLELDRVELASLEVPRGTRKKALDATPAPVRRAMERAVSNIESVHRAFLPKPGEWSPEPGIVVGRRPDPLERVGVYAPGGRAAYPSSVLMGVVPARVAGVREVVLCSPPTPAGIPSPAVLAAAELAGADRVFAVGGAGAIGAMAHGTATVPRVDRIIGPGNAYVAEAKLQVAGVVAIDSPAGPSELLVVADSSASPARIAAELVAQAEHDPRAAALAVALDERTASGIARAITDILPSAQRRDIVETALADRGGVVTADTLEEAARFASDYAPEHLLLALRDPAAALPLFRNAGTVFVGESASVSFGDYMTGANHVLPTGGLARSYSGLSVLDFFRWTTYQVVSPAAAASLAPDVAALAEAEGLPGHAKVARDWLDGGL